LVPLRSCMYTYQCEVMWGRYIPIESIVSYVNIHRLLTCGMKHSSNHLKDVSGHQKATTDGSQNC
jgi:hypothetical protein